MSYHSVPPRADQPHVLAAVGWDPRLASFLAYVWDTRASGDTEPLLNLGGSYGEHSDPQEVLDRVRPYAEVPEHLLQQLTNDQLVEGVLWTEEEFDRAYVQYGADLVAHAYPDLMADPDTSPDDDSDPADDPDADHLDQSPDLE